MNKRHLNIVAGDILLILVLTYRNALVLLRSVVVNDTETGVVACLFVYRI